MASSQKTTATAASNAALIKRIEVSNFKSLVHTNIELGPVTFLVGKNATGKSNLLDAIDFVGDALYSDVDLALRDRGGISSVFTRMPQRRVELGMSLDLQLPDGTPAQYTIRIDAKSRSNYRMALETCQVGDDSFTVRAGSVSGTLEFFPKPKKDRLYLSTISGLGRFSEVYDALTNLTIYRTDVAEMRKSQPVDTGTSLAFDAWNFASVLRWMQRNAPEEKTRIEEYLSAIVPGMTELRPVALTIPMETVEFVQRITTPKNVSRFYPQEMSDGTLRSLAILIALFQAGSDDDFVPFVGIEEPETGLHPAATNILYDAISEASIHRQIIATSHSPELLDRSDLPDDAIIIADIKAGETSFRRINPELRRLVHDQLITPGELLRRNQFESSTGENGHED